LIRPLKAFTRVITVTSGRKTPNATQALICTITISAKTAKTTCETVSIQTSR